MRASSIRAISAIALAGCSSSSSYDQLVVQTVDSAKANTSLRPAVLR
jgi:hypothetical protein